MRSHRVKIKRLTNQTTVIVDITIRKTALVRAAEHVSASRIGSLSGSLSLEPDSSIPAVRFSLRKSNNACLNTFIQARTLESASLKSLVSLNVLRWLFSPHFCRRARMHRQNVFDSLGILALIVPLPSRRRERSKRKTNAILGLRFVDYEGIDVRGLEDSRLWTALQNRTGL
jgi:hypothetical protein